MKNKKNPQSSIINCSFQTVTQNLEKMYILLQWGGSGTILLIGQIQIHDKMTWIRNTGYNYWINKYIGCISVNTYSTETRWLSTELWIVGKTDVTYVNQKVNMNYWSHMNKWYLSLPTATPIKHNFLWIFFILTTWIMKKLSSDQLFRREV